MTQNKSQQRTEKAQDLKAFQVSDNLFYVESSEGKICYRVSLDKNSVECTCGDFASNSQKDPNFKCKHILAVYSAANNGGLEQVKVLKKRMPKLDERFLMTLEGKDFVKYPGLLDLGHQKGISSVEVEIVQLPDKENSNFAVCQAKVTGGSGEVFTDIGDASPQNCNTKVAKHLLRMAATRAIARALRSYTNIGMTCLEELSDLEELHEPEKAPSKPQKQETSSGNKNNSKNETEKASKPRKSKKAATTKNTAPNEQEDNNAQESQEVSGSAMSTAQKSAIHNLAKRRAISIEELGNLAQETFGKNVEELTHQEASSFIRNLQQAA